MSASRQNRWGRLAAASATASLLLLSMNPGCKGDPTTEVVDGTAIDHGRALFDDPRIAGSSLNDYACSTCHPIDAADLGRSDYVYVGAPMRGVIHRPHYWGGTEVDLLRSINACLFYFMAKEAPWTADDVDARAMYAFLESLHGDASDREPFPYEVVGPVDEPALGDASRGAAVYQRACASCHGAAHTGQGRLVDRAPTLPEQTLEDHPLDEYTPDERRLVFVEKVRHGGFLGYGGQMPPFTLEQLTDGEMGDLLAFFDLPQP